MTTDIKQLPLPSVLLNWPHPTNHVAIRDYARAVAEYNVKALQADMATLEQHLANAMGEVDRLDKRAERLAEALRHLRNHTSVNSYQIELIDAALRDHEQVGAK